ncbi:hypothetical protein [Paludisphaera soli]|uniref:hypothetical protein n=1 Tax=Paludisphaera soli TaxID=2712865 RepID=UPI0013E9A673|nr:hypothetical protein [Paludisphaera soli]
MASDPNILEIPPGEYSIPGVDRILVVQGAAFWRLPSQLTNLADLARPQVAPSSPVLPPPATPPAAPTPIAPAGPSMAFYILLALVGTGFGAWALPKLDARSHPDSPSPIAPIDPAPRPAPPDPPQPRPRPDWLPQLEALDSRLDHLERSVSGPPTPPTLPIRQASPQLPPG